MTRLLPLSFLTMFGVFLVAFSLPHVAYAAIAFGALTSGNCDNEDDELNISAPTITGSDTALVLLVSINGGGEPLPLAATYNGVALGTPDVDSTRIDFVRTYGWILPSPVSAATFYVQPTANCVGLAAYYTGVDQATTFRTGTIGEGTASPGSLSVTNSQVGDLIVGAFGTHDLVSANAFTVARVGADQTFRVQIANGTDEVHMSLSDEPGASGTVTHSWTYIDGGSSNWTGVAIPLIEASSASVTRIIRLQGVRLQGVRLH